jgi:hypothetical protein
VPVREALVDHGVDALWLPRIGNVEDDAVARAGARGQLAIRKHRDVVALVGWVGLLRILAMVAAAPEAGEHARLGVREHGRAVDDARCRRIVDRDLDDVDAEQRRTVVAR